MASLTAWSGIVDGVVRHSVVATAYIGKYEKATATMPVWLLPVPPDRLWSAPRPETLFISHHDAFLGVEINVLFSHLTPGGLFQLTSRLSSPQPGVVIESITPYIQQRTELIGSDQNVKRFPTFERIDTRLVAMDDAETSASEGSLPLRTSTDESASVKRTYRMPKAFTCGGRPDRAERGLRPSTFPGGRDTRRAEHKLEVMIAYRPESEHQPRIIALTRPCFIFTCGILPSQEVLPRYSEDPSTSVPDFTQGFFCTCDCSDAQLLAREKPLFTRDNARTEDDSRLPPKSPG